MPCLSVPVTALKLPVSVIFPQQLVQIELSSRPPVCLQIQSEYGQIGIEVFLACCQCKSLSIARKRETAVNLAPECVCYWLRCVGALTTLLRIMWWRPLNLLLSHGLQTVLLFLSAFFKRRIFPWHNVILAIFWYCNCARKECVYVFTSRVSHRGKKSIMYLERETQKQNRNSLVMMILL